LLLSFPFFHFSHLDLDLVEGLSVVDSDDGSGHLWDDDHVPEVRLDDVGLLIWGALLLLLPQLLDEGHGLPLQSPAELPPDPAREQLHELLIVHVQQLVQVDPAVRNLAEGTLLLDLDSLKQKETRSEYKVVQVGVIWKNLLQIISNEY
jgi:hypothetical protein